MSRTGWLQNNTLHIVCSHRHTSQDAWANTTTAPAASAVRYETQKFNLAPIMKTEYVGYGPSVDSAWDIIANDSGLLPGYAPLWFGILTVLLSWRHHDHGGGTSQTGLLSQIT